jgi:phosphinothricin acetyltransferase
MVTPLKNVYDIYYIYTLWQCQQQVPEKNPFGEKKDQKMRIATESDLPVIVSIYNSTIPARQSTADTVEVTVESRRDWFRQHNPDKRPLMVHEQDNKVVAWVSFQSFYGRAAYDHTAEISIYVSPDYRGKGLGRALLREALERTRHLDIKTIVGFIFSHNTPSIKLFCSFGFEEWGKLPDVAEMDGKEFSLSIMGKRVKEKNNLY